MTLCSCRDDEVSQFDNPRSNSLCECRNRDCNLSIHGKEPVPEFRNDAEEQRLDLSSPLMLMLPPELHDTELDLGKRNHTQKQRRAVTGYPFDEFPMTRTPTDIKQRDDIRVDQVHGGLLKIAAERSPLWIRPVEVRWAESAGACKIGQY